MSNYQLWNRTNPVNKPASDLLEEYCLQIGEFCRNQKQPVILSAETWTKWFCERFDFRPPVLQKIGKLLDEFGIDWQSNMRCASGVDASYTFNEQADCWQIEVRENAGRMEGFYALHDLHEIIWWRCKYLIPEWEEWVQHTNMKSAHDSADIFAHEAVIPKSLFNAKAEEFCYNPIQLADHFQTVPGLCFQAFLRCHVRYPYWQARLDFEARSEQSTMNFEDYYPIQAKVHTKGTKIAENLRSEKWAAIFQLAEKVPSKGNFVPVEDWICNAMREKRTVAQETNVLLGLKLPGLVYAVVRPNYDKGFLQVVPAAKASMLMDLALEMQHRATVVLNMERY